jgi:hypothetical protein
VSRQPCQCSCEQQHGSSCLLPFFVCDRRVEDAVPKAA